MDKEFHVKLWVPGDWNAFFGLFSNVLTNVLVLSGLMLGVIKMPPAIVFGKIIPAVGISLIVGNIYYAYMAMRLAKKERRSDVAAMPYGPSVPHMFLVTFVIMLPVVLRTHDSMMAWRIGLAWVFIEGIIELSGAFFARIVRRFTPRAAMLGTLAGVSIAFISMNPAFQMVEVPWIGFVSLGLILLTWFGFVPMPWKAPGGLVIILVGSAIGWATGYMSPVGVVNAVNTFAPHMPSFNIKDLLMGMKDFGPLLAHVIEPTRRVLDVFRKLGLRIIYTREGHRPDLSDCPSTKRTRGNLAIGIGDPGPMGRILVRGEPGHDIVEELQPAPGEPIIDKSGKGAFYATELNLILKNWNIRSLIVTGVTTEVCVHTTVREANDGGTNAWFWKIVWPPTSRNFKE